jgi:hypothetical protein
MGIQGLLQFVKQAHEEGVCVSEYKDRHIGVDISTWIFRGESLMHHLALHAPLTLAAACPRVQLLRAPEPRWCCASAAFSLSCTGVADDGSSIMLARLAAIESKQASYGLRR